MVNNSNISSSICIFMSKEEFLNDIEEIVKKYNQVPSPPVLTESKSDIISLEECCELTGHTKNTLRQYKSDKKIPYIQKRRKTAIKFSRIEILEWIKNGKPFVEPPKRKKRIKKSAEHNTSTVKITPKVKKPKAIKVKNSTISKKKV